MIENSALKSGSHGISWLHLRQDQQNRWWWNWIAMPMVPSRNSALTTTPVVASWDVPHLREPVGKQIFTDNSWPFCINRFTNIYTPLALRLRIVAFSSNFFPSAEKPRTMAEYAHLILGLPRFSVRTTFPAFWSMLHLSPLVLTH